MNREHIELLVAVAWKLVDVLQGKTLDDPVIAEARAELIEALNALNP